MTRPFRPYSHDGFEIAIICVLPIEHDAVEDLLDEECEDRFSYGKEATDPNAYTTGRLGNQHVVLAYMPSMGMIRAAPVAANIRFSFEGIKVCMVVGICGAVSKTPNRVEIVLGDVIISTSVIQIDFGRPYSAPRENERLHSANRRDAPSKSYIRFSQQYDTRSDASTGQ